MKLLIGFLLLAAISGTFTRRSDLRSYVTIAALSTLVAGLYYYDDGLW